MMNKKNYIKPAARTVEYVSDVFMKHWSIPVDIDDPIDPGEGGDIGVKMEYDKTWGKRNLWDENW